MMSINSYSVFFNSSMHAPICHIASNFSALVRMVREGRRDGFVVRAFDYFGNEVKISED